MHSEKYKTVYDFSAKSIDGEIINLEIYKDKILLIVNVASKCGFTKQYEELEKLYLDNKEKGLVILGFPCSQFANQEFDTNEEIKNFCNMNYKISFPLFSKIDVNGVNQHPLYSFLQKSIFNSSGNIEIEWNFTKFLINSYGKVIKRYSPEVCPFEIESDLFVY